jgi:hypothetical protein
MEAGLDQPTATPDLALPGSGHLAATDLDGDGDVDIVSSVPGGIFLWENDGTGHFSGRKEELRGAEEPPGFAVADFSGDGLPELIFFSRTGLRMAENLGGMDWNLAGVYRAFVRDDAEVDTWLTLALGDLDGDGDLDIVAPGMSLAEDAVWGPTQVLRNDGDSFTEVLRLTDQGEPLNVQAALLTDREGDGDLDLLLVNDSTTRSTFWRNDGVVDGVPVLVEDSREVGIGLSMSGMGMDGADLNDDGVLDWCFSDTGPPRCFLSDAHGWFEADLGLVPADPVGSYGAVGWSIEMLDLDNDGPLELAMAGGEQLAGTPTSEGRIYPDLLWTQGLNRRFTDITVAQNFGDLDYHTTLAAADFDGDGFWELLLASPWAPPQLYRPACTTGAWLDVEPRGKGANPAGYGAWVEVEAGGRTQIRQLHALRSHGQGPSSLHFGLGAAQIAERVYVRWPDGAEVELHDVALRQQLRVGHP